MFYDKISEIFVFLVEFRIFKKKGAGKSDLKWLNSAIFCSIGHFATFGTLCPKSKKSSWQDCSALLRFYVTFFIALFKSAIKTGGLNSKFFSTSSKSDLPTKWSFFKAKSTQNL